MILRLKNLNELASGGFKLLIDSIRAGKGSEENTIKENEVRLGPTTKIPRPQTPPDSSSKM
jgi:hypothetical protein